MGETPAVSVVLCVYNAREYLRAALDSVLAQSFRDFELVLIDDGSTDGSREICDEYAAQDPRVHVSHIPNGGLAEARNLGVRNASGRYLAFVDADDVCSPRYLESLVGAITEKDTDVAICGVELFVDPGDEELSRKRADGSAFAVGEERVVVRDGCFGLFEFNSALWNKLFRRDIVVNHGIVCPSGSHYEDDAFWYQYAMWARSASVIPERLYRYRIRRGSIMDSDNVPSPKNRRDFIESVEFVTAYARRNGLDAEYSRFLVRVWLAVYAHVSRWFSEAERKALRREFIEKSAALSSAGNRLVEIGDRLVWINRRGRFSDLVSWCAHSVPAAFGSVRAAFKAARSRAFWKGVS